MLKKSQKEGKRALSCASAADQNSSTSKNPPYFALPSESSASASGDEDQSAEDEDELSSSRSQGAAPGHKFNCKRKGKKSTSPSCSDPGSQGGKSPKHFKTLVGPANKQSAYQGLESGTLDEIDDVRSQLTSAVSDSTSLRGNVRIIKEVHPGFRQDKSQSEIADNQSTAGNNQTDIQPQNLDPDNNEVAQSSSKNKRLRVKKDISANTDLILINIEGPVSTKAAKCVSKGVFTSDVTIAGGLTLKPKSKLPLTQKQVAPVETAVKTQNRNFNQQISMVAKGSTKSISVDISSATTQGKTTGNQTPPQSSRSFAAQATATTAGDRPTKIVSKAPAGKSFTKTRAQSRTAADAESIVLSSTKTSEKIYNLRLDSKALVKGGNAAIKDKWRKQTLLVRPVNSDDEWLGLNQQKFGPHQRKSVNGHGKVVFKSKDMILSKNKAQASVWPPVTKVKSKVASVVRRIESVPKKGVNVNNKNNVINTPMTNSNMNTTNVNANNTSVPKKLPSRPTTQLKATNRTNGPNQVVIRKASPIKVPASANSKSRHSNSLAASHQSRVPSAERPKSANEAVVFLREKILAQENDRSRKKNKSLLDSRNRLRLIQRNNGGSGSTSSASSRNRTDRNKSVKIFRRVRKRSRSVSPSGTSIATEFSKFNFLKLPIIWSFGLTQISIAKNVQEVLDTIKRRHAYHEVNLDLEILKWKTTPGFAKLSESVLEPSNFHDAIVFRASKILRKGSSVGIDHEKVSLTASDICQLFKLAILSAQVNFNPRGYILKNFPASTDEGIEFELLFYPSTAGLYFLNNHWSKNRALPPDVYQMNNFTRIHGYSEYEVEKAADHFGAKTIKVSNAEDLHGKRVHDVAFLVQFHIDGESEALKTLAEKNKRINGAIRRSKRSKGSSITKDSRKMSAEHYDKLLLTSKSTNRHT